MKKTMTALLAITVWSAWPLPASSHDQHAHQSHAAGEPGNP
jgi:hypothetical protein